MPNHPITISHKYDPLLVQRISTRPQKPIEIVDPNPAWPARFEILSQRIRAALGPKALCISHVGSTSVPGLPAKDIIDVDITVADATAEEEYVTLLEKAGFQFIFREPEWHQHRFFGCQEPYANIHVFGPESPELLRHQLFREWLIAHEEDRERYVAVKRTVAEVSRRLGEDGNEYNDRKEWVIRDILKKVYVAHGFLEADE